ncbi:MAG: DUF1501 domain-containing protein [Pseudomonadota bacterium]
MTLLLSPTRRRFLAALGVASAAALPGLSLPRFAQAAQNAHAAGKLLVLVELAGGNDGLNTVVPTRDDKYRALRPNIGIGRDATLTLDQDTGLHRSMREMADLWEDGELRIVEGVGYPDPNRSHFRSIEIWNSGGGANGLNPDGWISQAAAKGAFAEFAGVDAHGLVLGGEMGPLKGPGRFSAMRDVDVYMEALSNLDGSRHAVRPTSTVEPLEHVLSTYESAKVTGDRIIAKLERIRRDNWSFPDSGLGIQLQIAARLIEAGIRVPVIKVVQDGYDTHEEQPDAHAYLLRDLSEALGAFSGALKDIGVWQDTTIVTFSEFGRRAYENGSFGTDHGTAAPVFVAGGGVAGGFAGARPSLDRLFDRDLVFTTDYRALYDAILSDLWGIDDNAFRRAGMTGLQILRSA